jgi:hypothetical protein
MRLISYERDGEIKQNILISQQRFSTFFRKSRANSYGKVWEYRKEELAKNLIQVSFPQGEVSNILLILQAHMITSALSIYS